MKKFLALVALMAAVSASAEELKFGDLNYFLKAGQNNVRADFLVTNEVSRVGGADYENDGYFINTIYAHAISDQLNVYAEVEALLDGETSVANGASSDAQGLQNPSFGANYRAMSQQNSAFNLDFGVEATFKVVDRELGAPDDEGNSLPPFFSNYAEPRNGVQINTRLGKKWNEANEYSVLAAVNYNTKGDFEDSGSEVTDLDASMDYILGAFYQYRPVYEFMMTLGLTAIQYGEFDVEEEAAEYEIGSHIDYQFSFVAKYLITESLIGKFLFIQDSRSDFDIANTEVERRNGAQYGLGVDFLF